jgi:hypothetical protein
MARRSKRTKGSGSLKLRGRIWWIIFNVAGGRPISESSGSENRDVAEALLQQRIGAVARERTFLQRDSPSMISAIW